MTDPIDFTAFRERLELIGDHKPPDYSGLGCQHRKHLVDTKLRRVTCRDCGETLDPIEVIVSYIDYWHGVKRELTMLQDLRAEQRKNEREKEERRWARKVAREGGIWACRVDGSRSWFWDNGRDHYE